MAPLTGKASVLEAFPLWHHNYFQLGGQAVCPSSWPPVRSRGSFWSLTVLENAAKHLLQKETLRLLKTFNPPMGMLRWAGRAMAHTHLSNKWGFFFLVPWASAETRAALWAQYDTRYASSPSSVSMPHRVSSYLLQTFTDVLKGNNLHSCLKAICNLW